MIRLLYITVSPRGEYSYSLRASNAFIDSYRKTHPNDEIVMKNLSTTHLPDLGTDAIIGRYSIIKGIEHTPEQAKIWQEIKSVIDEFKSFDKYVISTPMWNFGIPYKLKHYIDVITHPTFTFGYVDGKRVGYMKGKPVVCIYARGGEYKGKRKKHDFQKPYLEWALTFIGFEDIKAIVIEPTTAGDDIAKEKLEKAIRKTRRIAKAF